MRKVKFGSLAFVSICLSACGGGGDSAAPAATTTTPPTTTTPTPTPPPPAVAVTFNPSSVAVTATSASDAPEATVTMVATNIPDSGIWIQRSQTNVGVASITFASTASTATYTIKFKVAGSLGPGTYTDTLTIGLCLDSACATTSGAPRNVSITYTVPTTAVIGTPPELSSRTALTHDVLDAEISVALNAMVMISSTPRNSLYVYDLATGAERELVLGKPARSLAISPDGQSAAVGHDALITHVALPTVGQASPTVKLLNVTADLGDVVLTNDYVYGLPRIDQWVSVHSIRIATNVETKSGTGFFRAGSLGRVVPSGQYFYSADNGLSPGDFEKWDLRAGTATRVSDSPYHGNYPICGNIWPSEDGTRLYTPCGATFRSTTDPTTDMTYAGSFDLSRSANDGPTTVISLSNSAEKKELMVVDGAPYQSSTCSSTTLYEVNCLSRLRYYDSEFLQLSASFTLPPLQIGSVSYPQRGLFVFHDGSGDGRYLISRAVGTTDLATSFYLSKVQR